MTRHDDVRSAVESVALLFLASLAGVIATLALLEEFLESEQLLFGYIWTTMPIGFALVVALVGGALVGLRVDDPSDAALGTAIGCAVGFAVLVVGVYGSLQLLDVGAVDSVTELLAEEWKVLSVHGAGIVVTGVVAAVAPSRLE